LMCSYCRSRFGLDPLGMSATSRLPPLHALEGASPPSSALAALVHAWTAAAAYPCCSAR